MLMARRRRRPVAEEEPAEPMPFSTSVAGALRELELEEQARAAAQQAESVLAVTAATRRVERVLGELLAGA
jgi:hypothetical protein